MSEIIPYLPYYCKPPNKLLRYYEKRFEGEHHSATLNIAVYLDKNKIEKEATAQVIWDEYVKW